jgi:putative ABC transport system permease protein
MSDRSVRIYRLLSGLLPADAREPELEDAFLACLSRERDRLGWTGLPYVWMMVTADTVRAAVLLRIDRRRRQRISAQAQPNSQGDPTMRILWQDVRYGARAIRRAPVFSAMVILTLALAIGALTAIFSVVNGVMLRAMPCSDPDRLAILYESIGRSGPIGFSAPDFRAFEQRVTRLSAIAAFGNRDYELSGIDQPERVTGARVSAELFKVLGVEPQLGRSFTRQEDEGRIPVALVNDGLWRRKFGADPSIVGRAILLERKPYTVIGVMPRSFVFPNRGTLLNNVPADVFVPISFSDQELTGFGSMYNNTVVGRLAPGASVAEASAEARSIAEQLVREIYPSQLREMGLDLAALAVPLRDETVGRVKTFLYVMLAAVATVLLIACADLANLLLTRAAAREREMAVRAALGASRGRLARQVLVEVGLLAACGGALGVVLALWSTGAIVRIAPPTIPRLEEVTIDWRVLAFTIAVSMLTALLCGVLPALEASRKSSGESLKDGGRGGIAGVRQRRAFGTLVTVQFALAVVMLVAGGLLFRSFARMMAVSPGFAPEHVVTLATSLPANAYATGKDIRTFYGRLLDDVGRLPGVTSAAAATDLPLSVRERRSFTIEAQIPATAQLPHVVAHEWVIGRYFETLGIRLVRGRFLSTQDVLQSERVVVINNTMARRYWLDGDPIGQRVAWGGAKTHGPWMRIVGIVDDVKQGPLNTETVPQTYQPWEQVIADAVSTELIPGAWRSMKLIVRTADEPSLLSAALRARVRDLDSSLPIAAVRTMEAVVSESASPQRFNTVMLGSFAVSALLLASLGIGGVLATSVSNRTQEIGVRMALGAARGDVLRMVLGQGMTLAVLGIAIGAPVALLLTRLMSSLLFEVSPRDPVTFGAVAGLLVLVALAACYVPARRATRVEPIVALRCE